MSINKDEDAANKFRGHDAPLRGRYEARPQGRPKCIHVPLTLVVGATTNVEHATRGIKKLACLLEAMCSSTVVIGDL